MENKCHQNILSCPVVDVLLDGPLPISRFFSLVPYIFDAVVASQQPFAGIIFL